MPIVRLPKANTWFVHYKDTQLATIAENIRLGLLATIADFPTPPVLPAALSGLITTYVAALAAAVDGSKQQTATKEAAKIQLQNALRLDCKYVNQIIYGDVFSGMTYEDAQALILSTGYQLSKDPEPVGNLPQAEIKKYGSPKPRQLSILVIAIPGARGYQVDYWITGEARNTAITFMSATSRILIPNLTSGQQLTFTVIGIGANNTGRIESDYKTQIIT